MSDFSPQKENIIDCERSLDTLRSKREALVVTKKELEFELSKLKTMVNSSGFLPPQEYARICKKQDQLKREKLDIESNIAKINGDIRRRNLLKDEIKASTKSDQAATVTDGDSVKKKLILLRDEYMKFSSDQTRISSMRAMAGKVAGEIQDIIKTI